MSSSSSLVLEKNAEVVLLSTLHILNMKCQCQEKADSMCQPSFKASAALSSWHVVFYVVLSLNIVDLHRE